MDYLHFLVIPGQPSHPPPRLGEEGGGNLQHTAVGPNFLNKIAIKIPTHKVARNWKFKGVKNAIKFWPNFGHQPTFHFESEGPPMCLNLFLGALINKRKKMLTWEILINFRF